MFKVIIAKYVNIWFWS